jgi:hypothetical protein
MMNLYYYFALDSSYNRQGVVGVVGENSNNGEGLNQRPNEKCKSSYTSL